MITDSQVPSFLLIVPDKLFFTDSFAAEAVRVGTVKMACLVLYEFGAPKL